MTAGMVATADAVSPPVDMPRVATWQLLQSSVLRQAPEPPPRCYVEANVFAIHIQGDLGLNHMVENARQIKSVDAPLEE